MTRPPGHAPQMEAGVERLVFFSDAVFAIAITLLVVDLRVPEMVGQVTDARLAEAVAGLTPRIFAYALSFAVIGLYWLTHWRRFAMIDRLDERMVLLNLLLLAFVAFIPFPTSLIGEYGNHDLAVIVYATTLATSGLVGTASWLYAARAGLISADVTRDDVRLGALRGTAVPAVMLGSLALLPLAGPEVVEYVWLGIFPLQWLIARLLHRAHATPSAH